MYIKRLSAFDFPSDGLLNDAFIIFAQLKSLSLRFDRCNYIQLLTSGLVKLLHTASQLEKLRLNISAGSDTCYEHDRQTTVDRDVTDHMSVLFADVTFPCLKDLHLSSVHTHVSTIYAFMRRHVGTLR